MLLGLVQFLVWHIVLWVPPKVDPWAQAGINPSTVRFGPKTIKGKINGYDHLKQCIGQSLCVYQLTLKCLCCATLSLANSSLPSFSFLLEQCHLLHLSGWIPRISKAFLLFVPVGQLNSLCSVLCENVAFSSGHLPVGSWLVSALPAALSPTLVFCGVLQSEIISWFRTSWLCPTHLKRPVVSVEIK